MIGNVWRRRFRGFVPASLFFFLGCASLSTPWPPFPRGDVQGLRGLALVRGKWGGGVRRVVLLVKRPRQVRGEILSEFGSPLESFVLGGKGSDSFLKEEWGVPLLPEEVVDLFLGGFKKREWRVTYSDYREVNGISWPWRMKVFWKGGGMTLTWEEVELNPKFKPGSFR